MTSSTASATSPVAGVQRVRERAKETVTVMAVSAAMSGGLAAVLTLVLSVGR